MIRNKVKLYRFTDIRYNNAGTNFWVEILKSTALYQVYL